MSISPPEILKFWFDETPPSKWFEKSEVFDQEIKTRFGNVLKEENQGNLTAGLKRRKERWLWLFFSISFHAIYSAGRPKLSVLMQKRVLSQAWLLKKSRIKIFRHRNGRFFIFRLSIASLSEIKRKASLFLKP